MLSLILKILRDKVGELYNSINRKMQPLPFGDDQDYILDSDTVTVSDFWKDFKKYSQSPALIGVFYVFLLLNIIINLFIIIMSFSNLSNHCLRNHLLSLVMALFWLFVPPIIWMYSTRYVFWNYHLYKYGSLILIALNDLIIIQKFIMSSFYQSLIHLLSIIPVGEYIGKDMIMQLGVFLFAGLPPLIPIYIGCKLYGTFSSDLVLDEIDRFKLDQYIDFRKSKEFAYDFKAVRYLSTGSQFVVKELDRFLHMYCDGTTGTAKTSSVLTVAIADDLDQKVYNEDYQKKACYKALKEGKLRICAPFNGTDFSINYFEPILLENPNADKQIEKENASRRELYRHLKFDSQSAGITVVAPNAAWADQCYHMAKNRKLKIHRIDPILKDRKHKEGFTGFNPFKIDPALTGKELATTITAQASNFATVVQSIYDQSGVSDPYFSSLNETVTVSIAELLMLTYHLVHPGQVPKASDVQNLINDCSRCRPYLDALIKHYSVHSVRDSGNDRTEQVAEVVDVGQWQQVYTTINNDLLGENKANMYDRCNGLRNLINNFLNDPLVRDVFEAEETVDIDKALEYGEIIILNYALERGDSVATGFGLFFLLSYETAVLRRPGSENDRIKNFIYIDELPVLLHPKLQSFFTLFRQYRVAVICAIQTLDQVKKIQLDSIMLGNCAHQIIFGRVSTTEMDIFSKMAGETLEHVTQETVTETAITAELPAYSYSRRSTPTLSERFSGTVFRYLGFQEVIFFSVNNSSPIYPFRGKVNFLPKPREKSAPRLKIEWEPFMPGPLHPSVFEKRFSVAHISSNGYFSSCKPGNYFLAGNKKSIPEPQVQTDLTTETTEAVSDAEDQTPVEPTHIITPTEHTDGIFFGE